MLLECLLGVEVLTRPSKQQSGLGPSTKEIASK
jgi:hypothetical protein